MPKVTWSKDALQDVDRLFAFLASSNPNAAYRASQTIVNAAKTLEEFPQIGKQLSQRPNYRELFASFGHGCYVLRYRLTKQGNVIIVRVWHSREHR